MSEVIQIGTQRFIYNEKKKQWVDEKTGKWAGEVILKIIDKALELDKKRQKQNENEEDDKDFKRSREQAKPKKPKVPKYEEPGQFNEKPEVSKDTVPENKRLPQKDIEEKVVQSTEKVSIGGQEFVFNEKKQEWQDKKTKTKVSPNLMMIINQALKKDNPEIETKPKLKDIIDKPKDIEKNKTAKKRLAEQTKKQLKNISLFLTYTENAVNDLDAISISTYKLISFTHEQEMKVSKESEFSYSPASSEINFDSLSNLFDKLTHAIDSFKERLSNQKETSSGIGTTAKRSIQKAKDSVKKVSQKAIKVAKDTVQKVATKIPLKKIAGVGIAVAAITTVIGGDMTLGSFAAKAESNNDASKISTGTGDAGGKSYGKYQLSLKRGEIQKFIKQSKYKSEFNGLEAGSEKFDEKFKEIAKNKDFADEQQSYMLKKYYYPQLEKLKRDGIDLSNRGLAVKEDIISVSNQYGPATNVIEKALENKDVTKMTDKEIIEAIQDYRRDTVNSRFKSSKENIKLGVAKRAEREKKELIAYAEKLEAKGGQLSEQSATNTIAKKKKTNNIVVIDNSTSSSNPINVIAQSSAGEQKKAAESFSTQQQLLSYFNAH